MFSKAASVIAHADVGDSIVWLCIAGADPVDSFALMAGLIERDAKVVSLSPMPDDKVAFSYLSEGAKGFCHSEAATEQLLEVSAAVTAGGMWMPPALANRFLGLAKVLGTLDPIHEPDNALKLLTQRELEVARMVGSGLSNREIAESLDLTERTIKAHLTSIFEKLQVRDRVQLALVVNGISVSPRIMH